MSCLRVIAVAFLLSMATVAQCEIIDHRHVDGVASLPQATMDAVGQQRWFFAHASVGLDMLLGMRGLHNTNKTRYQLDVSRVDYNESEMRAVDPGTTTSGTIYDCYRLNPGWSKKFTIFDNSVRASGWRFPSVDVAMDKLCYIDQDASATDYINMMSSLERDFRDTTFVYLTMPLKSDETSENRLRNVYNDAVRQYASDNGKLLFDIADMEAYDPDGNESTFEHEGVSYQKMYDGYTSDGGHLGTLGQQRIALGWYATAAAVAVPEPGTLTLLGIAFAALVALFRRRPTRLKPC